MQIIENLKNNFLTSALCVEARIKWQQKKERQQRRRRQSASLHDAEFNLSDSFKNINVAS
ncbi:MAG: hypothetical protein A3E94_01255 [Candidatus Zambryskibacteria bacterium RIFCSPHIGHO2_12_FULL_44_12b]|uniref:Uncharacterized protein n=1 Tax=Candidatus Zambryskibacteria bacterium RIFCSPLOWO2_01_FULL_45_21 TaxID=1802761 RepID=A0A1G2U3J3_9BACT|nr:MAG: hypothetical protein A3E94_01255 [Candidatus Zambryskibacteria bacterium RIFCSPHIGHO2_12_FULL_44_12b]OHB03460.1 MAG: hypothetical protein A3B14_02935 [Candidatus Zambryskibacteria bacterium RIFCSPLOWO2_01_FULL_45_21]